MRLRGRTDSNQKAVIAALRQIGCSVEVTSRIGNGFPDAVAGRNGNNFMLEIKDGSSIPSKRVLTPLEKRFAETWRGQLQTVYSPEEAVKYVLANS